MVALAELGYDGPVTYAPDRSVFSGMRRDPIVKKVSDILSRAWEAAGLTLDGKLKQPAPAES